MIDTIIVGSGPAGLSAALYTSRAGLKTVVLTGETEGGLLLSTEEIDNYLGMPDCTGSALADAFLSHAEKFGAQLLHETVDTIETHNNGFMIQLVSGKELFSKSVVFATGSTPRKLGVPGEQLDGVSYCATCDGLFFEDEHVAVVGGGETAVEDALYLAQVASSVHVLVRSSKWRATEPAVQKLLTHPRITVSMESSIVSIDGIDSVESVQLDDGRQLSVTGVFVAIGQEPNSSVAKSHVTLFADGFIQCSNVPGFFVAGDVTKPEHRQVAIAVGDGARAGIDVTRFVLQK